MAIDDNTSYELTGLQVKDLAQKVKAKVDSSSLAAVATSGDYTDLLNTPTIPTVNDATLTITQNGTTAGTFTANSNSDTTISLTDTTYTHFTGATSLADGAQGLVPGPLAGDDTKFLSGDGTWKTVSSGSSYTAGNGISIDANNEISVDTTVVATQNDLAGKQDTLTAGSNISISNNTISATDTTYSDFTGATSSVAGAHGLVPAPAAGDQGKVLLGDGTWGDATAKLVEMSYGEANAWAKFLAAYNAGSIVYCRASSNSDPSSGSQTRKAFMAYVNNATNPTQVEFQYVRSVSSKTDSQQCDQVFVYTLTNASGGTWSVASRNMAPKINVSGPITKTFTNGANASIAIGANAMTGATSSAAGAAGIVPAPAAGDDTKVLSGAGTWVDQPTVNNATLTIQRNGTNVDTFTANASTNKTINIDVNNGVLTAWNLVPTADTTAGWRALFPTNGVYVTFYDGNGSFTNKPTGWGVLTTKISYHDGSTTGFEIYQEFMASGSNSSYFRKGNTNGWYGNASDSGSFTMIYDQLSSPMWRTAWVASQTQAKRTIYLTGRNTCDITPDGQGGVIVDNLPYGYKMVRFTQTQKASFSGKKIGIRGLKASTSAFNRFSGISAGTTKNWSQYSMPSVGSNNVTDAFSDSLNSTQLTLEYTCIRCGSGNEWTVAGTLSDYGANTHYQFSILCEAKDGTTVPNIFFRGTSSSDFSIFYSSIEILQ